MQIVANGLATRYELRQPGAVQSLVLADTAACYDRALSDFLARVA
ncbi:MAG TPA: hypothetical protein VJX92_25930 [Methylomirabilota bacterium]|nr:hypothetical protein [Methylomirabilota bacterium]